MLGTSHCILEEAEFHLQEGHVVLPAWWHEIKRRLLLGRKATTNLVSILKSRDITWPTKARLVKAMVFPVVMYGCEGWPIKKAEHWRIDAFELWCWRRLLRVPWTARRSTQYSVSLALLGYGSFSDLPCFWLPWQFWEILVKYFIKCPNIGIYLIFLSW